MFIDDCENCTIVTGPIDGSIMIRTCKNCSISTIASQIRFRDCQNIKVFAFCKTDPAVESSYNIFFAPYNAFFPHLKELFTKANFTPSDTNHISSALGTFSEVSSSYKARYAQNSSSYFTISSIYSGYASEGDTFDWSSYMKPCTLSSPGMLEYKSIDFGYSF